MIRLPPIPPDRPVLIAGATASGKSALALRIAREAGGVIVNADASQVYGCWRVVTARPSPEDEAAAPHRLYGHVAWDAPYSAGHWLREVAPLLRGGVRPIIVGGTGLYFSALTQGLAEIPDVPAKVRAEADALPIEAMLADLDPASVAALDTRNRARVQRAWEVQTASGKPLTHWQAQTPAPLLALGDAVPLALDAPRDWLLPRIARRFDAMLEAGALDEVAAMRERFDPALPAFKAIGVPELVACLDGQITLEEARERVAIATRRFAKRQRTWFRARMRDWQWVSPEV
ncbi:MAG: tRNA (adenosine(37)-N6)-dimethylallyltransferase MiaA [Sedimentitalea sp.]|nr:tRNA (adenosine(37)-N6)-dimethylallyltransferase MiaA [Sedimentitalea sp.]